MFGKFMNSIPIIGHGKAAWHYVNGDTEEGDKAFYEATRTGAVMAGGAVGVLGGPAGMVAGATTAGILTDTVTSVLTNEPKGVIQGIDDIASDISDGKIPLGSVARTGFMIGSDVIGGMGGASITGGAAKAFGQSAGKKMGGDIVKVILKDQVRVATHCTVVHGTTRAAFDNEASSRSVGSSSGNITSSSGNGPSSSDKTQQTNESEKATPSESSGPNPSPSNGGSGGKPPDNNQNNNKKEHEAEKPESHWESFLNVFKKKTLEEIRVEGIPIFSGLNDGQKKSLKDLIIAIRKTGYLNLAKVVKIALKILEKLGEGNVTFHNFQNVVKFALAYIQEQIAQRNDAYNQTPSNFSNLSDIYDTRRIQLADIILSAICESISGLVDLFNGLMNETRDLMATISPQFVNLFAAAYHFFKHKCIPGNNVILNEVAYFDIARRGLNRLQALSQFQELINGGSRRIVYEKFDANVGRRLMIVVKKQGSSWNLSSCYFLKDIFEDDEDGDEWINGTKLPRK